jgi:hypothetical protein
MKVTLPRNLSGCNFSGCDLSGCDATQSIIRECNFSNTIIRNIKINHNQITAHESTKIPIFFDPLHSADTRYITSTPTTATRTTDTSSGNWMSCHTYPFTSGKHSITFTITNIDSGHMMIGVSNADVDVRKAALSQECSLVLYSWDGYLWSGDRQGQSIDMKYGKGDSVEVEVDCDGRTVLFIRNSNQRSNPIPIPPSITPPFRFSCDLYPRDSISIVKGYY